MKGLGPTHPMQRVFGGLLMASDLASRNRQLSLGVICEAATEWATETADVFREIARDAGCGAMLVEEAAKDGVFSPTEARQIGGLFREIEEEAVEGKVIR